MDRATAVLTDKRRPPQENKLICRLTGRGLARRRLPRLVVEIAKFFDGERSVAQVAARAQISEDKCAAVVRKLTALGVLEAADPFTDAEQRFFAADPAPIDECDEPFPTTGERLRTAVAGLVHRLRVR